MSAKFKVKTSELKSICDSSQFKFKNTSQVSHLETVIGQKRAVSAIEFGLNMKSPGYNIFVTGAVGTGKSTIIRSLVRQYAESQENSSDWCMVNNFKDAFVPKNISLPSGKASMQRGFPGGLPEAWMSVVSGQGEEIHPGDYL